MVCVCMRVCVRVGEVCDGALVACIGACTRGGACFVWGQQRTVAVAARWKNNKNVMGLRTVGRTCCKAKTARQSVG
jgi:hypothetical protein